MDEKLKHYADMLFEHSLFESPRTLQDERRQFHQNTTARSSSPALPLSGTEIQGLERLFSRHIDRCVEARLDSFRKAFQEAKQNPTSGDFDEILSAFRGTQQIQIAHSTQALRQFILTRGGTSR